MKVILLLLCCMVAVSWQYYQPDPQQFYPPQFYRSQYYNPFYPAERAHLPFRSPSGYPYYQQYQPQEETQRSSFDQEPKVVAVVRPIVVPTNDEELNKEAERKLELNEESITARVASGLQDKAEGRKFFLPALLLGKQIFTTSTVFRFVTSTITSTNLQSCIAAASFFGGSTQACRRRREIAEIKDYLEELEEGVAPSQVQAVEPTVYKEARSIDGSEARAISDLGSSLDTEEDREVSYIPDSTIERANRQFTYSYPGVGFGTTIYSTVTTYSISVTAARKTVLIGSSLSCLPVGFTIC